MVEKARFNFIVDAVLLFSFLALGTTGALIFFTLPPGSGHNLSVWGWSRHEWGTVHVVFACAMVLGGLVHIMLHLPWIRAMVVPRHKPVSRFRGGVALVLVLAVVSLCVSPLLSPVRKGADGVREAPEWSSHRSARWSFEGRGNVR